MNRILVVLALGAVMLPASAWPVPANEPKPAPKPILPALKATTGKPLAKTVKSPALPPDILQRRRRGIAAMLEGNLRYRGALLGGAGKIANAKLAGPFEHTYPRIFSATDTTVTLYCATATLLPSGNEPSAVITVIHPPEGGERLMASISTLMLPHQCRNADFKPFPEMEQLRVQRRRALGHAD
ncbi:hypothetical protein [Bradyrhizobium sp.]